MNYNKLYEDDITASSVLGSTSSNGELGKTLLNNNVADGNKAYTNTAPINILKNNNANKEFLHNQPAASNTSSAAAASGNKNIFGGLANIPWKEIAIVAGAAGLLAALIALVKKTSKSIKLRFNKSVRTLARMQKDFTLDKRGLDMRKVLPGVGSKLNDFLTRVISGSAFLNNGKSGIMGNTKTGRKFKDGVIGLYPFCDIYKEELRNDFTMAKNTFNKIKIAADNAGDVNNESFNGKIYISFYEAIKTNTLNESNTKTLNEGFLTLAALAPMAIRGGAFIVRQIKNGKEQEPKTVQVTKQSTREICYAIMNNFFEKYISFEQVSKKMGVEIKGLSDIDASSIDKFKQVLKAYSNPDAGSIVKQYTRVKKAYDGMLGHYLNIGNGIIKNFEKYTKADDEKHENLLIAAKEKLQAMWDQQKDQYENLFPYVMMEIVNDGVYAEYIDFIIEKVLPVFKTGIAGDADYVLDVMPKKGDLFLLRQTAQPGEIGNKAVAKIVKDYNKETKKIEIRLLGLFTGNVEINPDGSCKLNNLHEAFDKTKYSTKAIELDYSKFMALDPHIIENKDDVKIALGDKQQRIASGTVVAVPVTEENRERLAPAIQKATNAINQEHPDNPQEQVNPSDVKYVYVYLDPKQKPDAEESYGYVAAVSTSEPEKSDIQPNGTIDAKDSSEDEAGSKEGESTDGEKKEKKDNIFKRGFFAIKKVVKFILGKGGETDDELKVNLTEQEVVNSTPAELAEKKEEDDEISEAENLIIYKVYANSINTRPSTIYVLFANNGDAVTEAKIYLQSDKNSGKGYAIARPLKKTTVKSVNDYIEHSDYNWVKVENPAEQVDSKPIGELLKSIEKGKNSKWYDFIANLGKNDDNSPLTVSADHERFDKYIELLQSRESSRNSNSHDEINYIACKSRDSEGIDYTYLFHLNYDKNTSFVSDIVYAYIYTNQEGHKGNTGRIEVSKDNELTGKVLLINLQRKYSKYIYDIDNLPDDDNAKNYDVLKKGIATIEDDSTHMPENTIKMTSDNDNIVDIFKSIIKGELVPNKEDQDKIDADNAKVERNYKIYQNFAIMLDAFSQTISLTEVEQESEGLDEAKDKKPVRISTKAVKNTNKGQPAPAQPTTQPTQQTVANAQSRQPGEQPVEQPKSKITVVNIDDSLANSYNSVFSEVRWEFGNDKKTAVIHCVLKNITRPAVYGGTNPPVKFDLIVNAEGEENFVMFKVEDNEGCKASFTDGKLVFKQASPEEKKGFFSNLFGKKKKENVPTKDAAMNVMNFFLNSCGELTLTDEQPKEESLNDSIRESVSFAVTYVTNDKVIESAAFNTGINRKITANGDCSQYYVLSECMWSCANDETVKKALASKVTATLKNCRTKEGLMEYAKANQNVEFTKNFTDMNYAVRKPGNLHSIIGCSLFECAVAVKFNSNNVISNAIGIGINKIS